MQRDMVANCTTSVKKAKVYLDVYPLVCVRKEGGETWELWGRR
jgi:hypothetical protein